MKNQNISSYRWKMIFLLLSSSGVISSALFGESAECGGTAYDPSKYFNIEDFNKSDFEWTDVDLGGSVGGKIFYPTKSPNESDGKVIAGQVIANEKFKLECCVKDGPPKICILTRDQVNTYKINIDIAGITQVSQRKVGAYVSHYDEDGRIVSGNVDFGFLNASGIVTYKGDGSAGGPFRECFPDPSAKATVVIAGNLAGKAELIANPFVSTKPNIGPYVEMSGAFVDGGDNPQTTWPAIVVNREIKAHLNAKNELTQVTFGQRNPSSFSNRNISYEFRFRNPYGELTAWFAISVSLVF